jgi:hypothetical protein
MGKQVSQPYKITGKVTVLFDSIFVFINRKGEDKEL